jgi:stress-induced morphogen
MSLEQQLIERLQQLQPTHLEVINESAGHGGYYPGKESHFKVVIVSEAFEGLRLVQRHQKIYALAAELLALAQSMLWPFMRICQVNGKVKHLPAQNVPMHLKLKDIA